MQQWGITRCFTCITVMNTRSWNNYCCKSWSAQAWKLLGNVHMCPSQCLYCAQHVYELGHSLYTGATAWPLLVHWRCMGTGLGTFVHFQAVSNLGQSTFYSSESTSFYVFSPTYIAVKTLGLLHPYFCHLSCIPLCTWPVTNFQGCFQSLKCSWEASPLC